MLTAITIINLKPREADYRVAHGDGLYILVRPNGAKLWRYDYRLAEVRRTLSIGEYDEKGDAKYGFTLAQARAEQKKAEEAVARGQHPATQKQKGTAKADKAEEVIDRTFAALADDWLVAREIGMSPKTTTAIDAASATSRPAIAVPRG